MNLRFLVGLLALPIMACNGLWGAGDDDDDDDEYDPSYSSECEYNPSSCGEPWTPADAGVGTGDAGDAAADGDAALPYPAIDSAVGTADLTGCTGNEGLAYVISSTSELSFFDPSTFTTKKIATVDCSLGDWPVAMTASRSGSLYVLYAGGDLYAMDPIARACTKVSWSEGSYLGGESSIAIQQTGGTESLSLLGGNWDLQGFQNLSRVDLAAATTSLISTVPLIDGGGWNELVGDAYNRLFMITGPHVMSIDPSTGSVLGVDAIPGYATTPALYGLAGMVIGQNVYELAIHKDDTTVYRYDLTTKQTTASVQLLGDVVAATAVPCTP